MYRKGDKVTIEAEVYLGDDETAYVKVKGYHSMTFKGDEILSHTKTLIPGDRAHQRGSFCTVIAVDEGHAFVKWELSGGHGTAEISTLIRVDSEPLQQAAE